MRILVMMRMYNFLEASPQFDSHNIHILWTKLKKLWGLKKKRWATRKSCVYSLVQIGFTLATNDFEQMAHGMAHGFSHGLIWKWGTIRFYRPWPEGFSVNHPLMLHWEQMSLNNGRWDGPWSHLKMGYHKVL